MIAHTATTKPNHDNTPSAVLSARAWVMRAMTRFTESRRYAAEREIARFIENNGDRLTDENERRIASGRI